MRAVETETITVRIELVVNAGLKAAAARERRGLANVIERIGREYCGRNAVNIDDSAAGRLTAVRNKQESADYRLLISGHVAPWRGICA